MKDEVKGSRQVAALNEVQRDLENAHLAWQWLVEQRAGQFMAACAETIYQFFSIRSRFSEGIAWFEAGAAALEGLPGEAGWQAMLLSRQGSLLQRLREHDAAEGMLERSRAILAGLDEPHEMGFCLIGLGGVHLRRKNFPSALEFSRQALVVFTQAGSLDGQSYALYLEGLILNRQGDFDAARPLLERSTAAARRSGNPRRCVAPLNLLGDIACIRGEYPAAEGIFSEALETARQLNDRFNLGILANNLATVYHLTGRYDLAERAYLESLEICREQGDRDGEALALNNLGELAVARGQFAEAEALSSQALAIAEELGEEWTIIVCLYNLGEAASGAGQFARGLDYYRRGAGLAMAVSASDQTARIAINAARALQRSGEEEAAVALLQAALLHPAAEQVEREKGLAWLAEMQAAVPSGEDESRLDGAVRRYLLQES
jgi:tetratricopeptide (TPR) repeat protein